MMKKNMLGSISLSYSNYFSRGDILILSKVRSCRNHDKASYSYMDKTALTKDCKNWRVGLCYREYWPLSYKY